MRRLGPGALKSRSQLTANSAWEDALPRRGVVGANAVQHPIRVGGNLLTQHVPTVRTAYRTHTTSTPYGLSRGESLVTGRRGENLVKWLSPASTTRMATPYVLVPARAAVHPDGHAYHRKPAARQPEQHGTYSAPRPAQNARMVWRWRKAPGARSRTLREPSPEGRRGCVVLSVDAVVGIVVWS